MLRTIGSLPYPLSAGLQLHPPSEKEICISSGRDRALQPFAVNNPEDAWLYSNIINQNGIQQWVISYVK